jgi:3-dehydroquinate synthase
MVCAAHISEEQTGFGETGRLVNVLQRYGLPTYAKFNAEKIFSILKMDKKRKSGSIHYILLDSIGKSRIMPLPLAQIRKFLLSTKKW